MSVHQPPSGAPLPPPPSARGAGPPGPRRNPAVIGVLGCLGLAAAAVLVLLAFGVMFALVELSIGGDGPHGSQPGTISTPSP